jgi:hypothetical protein
MDVSLLLDQENRLNHERFVDKGGFGARFCETAAGVLERSIGGEG